MARKLDSTIEGVLNEIWPNGWTLDDVKRRCKMVRVEGSQVETFYVDDVPALELWPIETEMVPTETGWTYKVTRNYRELTRG